MGVHTLFGKDLSVSNHHEQPEYQLATALCNAFKLAKLHTKSRHEKYFQNRDFIYFLRTLNKLSRLEAGVEELEAAHIKPAHLLKALMRQLNGTSDEELRQIAKCFFGEVKRVVKDANAWSIPSFQNTTARLIIESLKDKVEDGKSPNTSAFRYIMLIDPTETETAVTLLLDILKKEEPELLQRVRVISVGGFSDDTREAQLADVVLNVKLSMEQGHIVLLINSGPTVSAFYDLFNLHFSELPDRDGSKRYYTNLAVGSLSHGCIVHPDFKLLLHMPLSQLPTEQVPLLDRFEKYTLGIDHVLKERVGTCEQFHVVHEAMVDFVQNVHRDLTHRQLLFGYHEETLSSLLLQGITNADHNGNLTMPEPFSSLPAEDFGHKQESKGAALMKTIRRGNFKLLQIARPEQLLLHERSFAKGYVREYMCSQEHFNVIVFLDLIKHKLSLLNAPTIEVEAANCETPLSFKWCLYTRTSASHPELAKVISKSLKIPQNHVELLQVNQITSSEQCSAIVEKTVNSLKSAPAAKENAPKYLICVAHMRETTPSQLNFFRHRIDENVKHEDNIIVVLLLHFPAEMLFTSQAVYPAIFMNGWDFMYIDAFGVSLHRGLEELEDIASAKEGREVDHIQNWVDRNDVKNARMWLAWSFGLVDKETAKLSEAMFEPIFYDLIRELMMQLTPILITPALRRSLKHSLGVYTRGQNAAENLIAFLKSNKWISSFALSLFLRSCENSLVREVVVQVLTSIKKGEPVKSLIQSVQNSLSFTFRPIVHLLLQLLLRNFNLESVMSTLASPSADSQRMTELIEAVLRISFESSAFEVQTIDKNIILDLSSQERYYPPNLPMFDVIEGQLNSALQQYKLEQAQGQMERDIEHVLAEKTMHIAPIFQMIESSSTLSDAWLRDILNRSCGFQRRMQKIPDLLTAIVRTLSHPSCIGTFLIRDQQDHFLSFLDLFLEPLEILRVPFRDFDDAVKQFTHQSTNDAILLVILESIVSNSWKKLESSVASELDGKEPELAITDWMKVMVHLMNLKSFDIKLMLTKIYNVSGLIHKLETMEQLFFFFVTNKQVPFSRLLEVLKQSKVASVLSDDDPLAVIKALLLAPSNVMDKQTKVTFAQLALSFALRVGMTFNAESEDPIPYHTQKYLTLLFDIASGSQATADLNPFFTDSWLASQLAAQLSPTKPVEWWEFVQNELERRLVGGHWFRPLLFSCNSEEKDPLLEKFLAIPHVKAKASEASFGSKLHRLLFHVHYQSWASKLSQTLSAEGCKENLITLSKAYHGVLSKFHGGSEIPRINLAALASHCIGLLADFLSTSPARMQISLLLKNLTIASKDFKTALNHIMSAAGPVILPEVRLFLLLSPERMEELSKDQQAREWFGLPADHWAWPKLTNSSALISSLPYFPFMTVEEESPLGVQYQMVRNLVMADEVEGLIELSQNAHLDTRMCLLLVLYHEIIRHSQKPGPNLTAALASPQTLLAKALELTPVEHKAFAFILNGCQIRPATEHDVVKLFLPNGLTEVDVRIPYLLVNLLAFILGTPHNATPFYARAFNIQSMAPYVPGSSHGHANKDCGFQTDENNFLKLTNGGKLMMGGNQSYRLALCFLIWGSMTWGCLLFPEESKSFRRLFAAPDAEKFRGEKLDEIQTVRTYTWRRANMFIQMLESQPETKEKQLASTLFVTDSLLQLRQDILANPRRYNGSHMNENEAIEWENLYLQHLNSAMARHPKLVLQLSQKVQYPSVFPKLKFLNSSFTLQLIRGIDAIEGSLPATNNTQTKEPKMQMSEEESKEAIGSSESEGEDEGEGGPEKREAIVPAYLARRSRLEALQYIPTFVYFWQLVHRVFEYKISEDYLLHPWKKCIKLIADETPNETMERLLAVWKKFKEHWKKTREILGQFTVCRRAGAADAFIPEFTDDTLFSEFITLDSTSPNHIKRIIDELLVPYQELKNSLPEVLDLSVPDYHLSTKNNFQLSVLSLPYEAGMIHRLLNEHPTDLSFELFVASHINLSQSPDNPLLVKLDGLCLKPIEAEIQMSLIGRPLIDTKDLDHKFGFCVNILDEATVGSRNTESLVKSNTGVSPLRQHIRAIQGATKDPIANYLRQQVFDLQSAEAETDYILQSLLKEELLTLASSLVSMLKFLQIPGNLARLNEHMKEKYHSKKGVPVKAEVDMTPKEIAHIINDCTFEDVVALVSKKSQLLEFRQIPLKYIIPLSKKLVDLIEKHGFLYKTDLREFEEKVPQDIMRQLKACELSILGGGPEVLSHWHEICRQLIIILDDSQIRPSLMRASQTSSLNKLGCIDVQIRRLIDTEASVTNIFPDEIKPCHYSCYLRYLHLLILHLEDKMKVFKKDSRYVEKIPSHFFDEADEMKYNLEEVPEETDVHEMDVETSNEPSDMAIIIEEPIEDTVHVRVEDIHSSYLHAPGTLEPIWKSTLSIVLTKASNEEQVRQLAMTFWEKWELDEDLDIAVEALCEGKNLFQVFKEFSDISGRERKKFLPELQKFEEMIQQLLSKEK